MEEGEAVLIFFSSFLSEPALPPRARVDSHRVRERSWPMGEIQSAVHAQITPHEPTKEGAGDDDDDGGRDDG